MTWERTLKDPSDRLPSMTAEELYRGANVSPLCGIRTAVQPGRTVRIACSEPSMSGRILRVEPYILRGKITAPHRRLAITYAQVNANANIPALQIVGETLEIGVLRLSMGEHAQVPKRHTHPLRPDVRFLMAFANRHSQAAPIGVCTVDCSLDQGRIHNSFGNALGLLGIAR